MSTYGLPSRKEAERLERVRAMAGQRMRNYGTPLGPDPGIGLEGRRGVADSVPQEQLTPEQFRERNMPRNNLEIPRLSHQGRVWDQTLDRGAGGYGERAPNPQMMEHVRESYQDAMRPGNLNMEVEVRARALGIDPSAYSLEDEKGFQLEADVDALWALHEEKRKNYDAVSVPGGGHRWTANARMREQMDNRQGDQIIGSLWNRWHEQAGKAMITGEGGQRRPMTYADFAAAYRAGEGLSPTQRAAQLQSMITPLKAQKRTEVSDSIKQRAQQDNMARRMNTSVANIVFSDSLQNAQNPEDMIRTLVSGHVQNPNLGLGNMATMMQRGTDDLAAQRMMGDQAREQASANLPGTKARLDLEKIRQSGATGPAMLAELERHASNSQPPNVAADPAVVSNQVIANAGDYARSIADRDPTGQTWTAEEKLFMSQLSRHYAAAAGEGKTVKDNHVYANWANSLGLQPNDHSVKMLWKEITGGESDVRSIGDIIWDNMGFLRK